MEETTTTKTEILDRRGLFKTGAAAVLGGTLLRSARAAEDDPAPGIAPPVGAPRSARDEQLIQLIKNGVTMEEIAALKNPIAATPQEAVRLLKAGNARFFSGQARRPEVSAQERRAQILGQTPFAVVLGCSDSRVPIEVVLDQGLGDIFVIRVAGNIVESSTLGSIEYAVEHLKSKVVVVMGHEGCGAVKAAMLSAGQRSAEPKNVQYLLDRIVPAVSNLPEIRDTKARMREAVIANVRRQVFHLKQNPVIQQAVKQNRITVIGAFYEITSGIVDFMETDEELRIDRSAVISSGRAR